MLEYRFHHVSLLASGDDLAKAVEDFYTTHFDMRVAQAAGETPELNFAFLADRFTPQGAPFEIIRQVCEQREADFLARHGPALDHVCFEVPDLEKAVDSLSAAGLSFHVEPYDFLGAAWPGAKIPAAWRSNCCNHTRPPCPARPLTTSQSSRKSAHLRPGSIMWGS